MIEKETNYIRLMMAIRNGLTLFLNRDCSQDVQEIYHNEDGFNCVIEFEGKEYKIKITPMGE